METDELDRDRLGQNDAKLGDFLTYAPVLLRTQSRRVVTQSLVTAAADLVPEFVFSGLVLQGEMPNLPGLVGHLQDRLLRDDETFLLLNQILALLHYEEDTPASIRIVNLEEPLKSDLISTYLYLAPVKTPNHSFGYLLGGTQAPLSSVGRQYLKALSDLAGIALDNALRFDDLKEAAHDMGLVNEMAGSLAASLNGEELFNSFITRLVEIMPLERANLILLPPMGGTYTLPFSWSGPPGHTRRVYLKDLPLLGSPFEKAINTQEIISGHWQNKMTASLDDEINVFKGEFPAQMIIPLIAKRQVVGALALGSRNRTAFQEEYLRRSLLEKLAALFALALLNSRLYEEKLLSAEFDSRIGVYNHDFFDRELVTQMHKARRNDYRLGLMMVDMDNLKLVNDQHGHLAGDAALRHIASLITRTVRTTDVVARYGGDEFGVLLPGCTQMGLEIVAEKTRRSIRNTPLMLDNGSQVRLTVSIGAVLCPEDATNSRELIQMADAAMYVAKSHRDQVRVGVEAVIPSISEQDLNQSEHLVATIKPEDLPELTESEYERVLLSLGTNVNSAEGRVIHELSEKLGEARRRLTENDLEINKLQGGLWRQMQLLAELVERREPYLTGGATKLAQLVRIIGERLNLTESEIAGIEAAAWLANVGRIAVPEAIWNRPGPLSSYEWKRVRQVPLETVKLLKLIEDLLPASTNEALHFQRERFDGTGYPKGLAGEDIPRPARLLGIASALVAMSQVRPFRKRLDRVACQTQLERGAGRQWETSLTNLVLELLRDNSLDFLDFA